MTNYVVSNAFNLWSISASSSGDGKAAIVDRGRAFYAGDGNANTLFI